MEFNLELSLWVGRKWPQEQKKTFFYGQTERMSERTNGQINIYPEEWKQPHQFRLVFTFANAQCRLFSWRFCFTKCSTQCATGVRLSCNQLLLLLSFFFIRYYWVEYQLQVCRLCVLSVRWTYANLSSWIFLFRSSLNACFVLTSTITTVHCDIQHEYRLSFDGNGKSENEIFDSISAKNENTNDKKRKQMK